MKVWMRDLRITLTSTLLGKSIVYGSNWEQGKDDIAIKVTGTKYLSIVKDSFTVTLYNLTYSQIIQLITGQYYKIKIQAGYRGMSLQTVFEGAVIYISKQYINVKDSSVIIVCGSELVASYGQSKMNLTLNSGINMYAAITYFCKLAGISNVSISSELKSMYLTSAISNNGSSANWLSTLLDSYSLSGSTDSSTGSSLTITNLFSNYASGNTRTITLTNDFIVASNGYPTISSDGLTITIKPTFALTILDTIVIDNSILDLSVSSYKTSEFNKSYYIDQNGEYIVYQLSYSLSNRDNDFTIEVTGKSKSLYGAGLTSLTS